jgi:hypothetical protein
MPDDQEDRAPQGSDSGRPALAARHWHLSWRLIALIAVPAAAVVALGGQRTSQLDNGAASNQQVQQLANLGNAVAGEHGLTCDLEDEADGVAAYVAAGRTGAASALLLPQAHFDITNLQETQFAQLTSTVSAGASPQVQGALTAAEASLQGIKIARSDATSADSKITALATIQAYYTQIGPLLALDEQIASTSGDPTLSADVRALDALSRAEDAASEERAVLDAALTSGAFQTGELTQLSESNADYTAELAEFEDGLSNGQLQAYDNEVSGTFVFDANGMLTAALDRGVLPANPSSTFPTTERAWYESMTFEVNQMRLYEQSLLDAIQARSQALGAQATQAVLDTWLEVLAALVALLAIAVVAARRSSASGSVHWI